MPKIKSHSGSKKRFRRTASGKWLHRKSGLRHLLTGMSSKRGRGLRTVKVEEKNSSEGKIMRAYLPYA
ncbi:MAG: 50S ribosomal protein L35 [Elusimicrobia bacterium GWC2_51_8]|nr:MAG: 50S ribosomal protein L35 [Elusimicrobia bacterium GWA2_51_34]OGR61751.1 MAG: 50S ribosomal protein L35 [Elusimicrobia bacterium GWC2_51_8]OGR88638.1 MAG: 50S ribosomal protein L35 [Elusimicrobia bacterium GWF2_52_66]HAF96033.1 50S ribosomal protein L35 [Elusimicrobiota bacterium]HCE98642.1 50S ribosomal protein L35 [Elusimicrobiota bacterium]